jgi:hypothetical protein
MRAREFITEQKLSDMHDGLEVAATALPSTYAIPELQNQDFYRQYRFGVAIAAVRGEEGTDDVMNGFRPNFKAETSWGENQIVSSFDPNIGKVIDKALKKVGVSGKKLVSSKESEEVSDTNKSSPVKPFKGYPK